MTFSNSQKCKAFTLIELLVVIAIIGILAAALFPAVSGAIVRANATAMANRGKNVVMSIIAANIEREQFSLSAIWPRTTGTPTHTRGVDYFADMIEPAQGRPRIENIDWTYFAGGGVAAASSRSDFTSDPETHMAWRTMFNIRETDSDAAPFMITRNVDILSFPAEGEEFNADDVAVDSEMNPFGNRMMVWVMKGGAAQSVRPDLVIENPQMFMTGGALNSEAQLVYP